MTFGRLAAIAGVAVLSVAISAEGAALAQASSPTGPGGSSASAPVRPRIEVNPRPIFRRCTSWYVVQNRPSGQVLFPERHCWWVRG